MKVAELTKYGQLAASTRQRFGQYEPYLKAEGFAIETQVLLDDDYLKGLYAGKRTGISYLLSRYANRARWLLTAGDTDVLWINYELFPFLPGPFELLSRYPGKPVIFDFDDAVFHNYDLHGNPLIRASLGRKIGRAISTSNMCFCGNRYLADYARRFCSNVEIVPTVLDTRIYVPSSRDDDVARPRIGWIGTPSTWNEYVQPMMPMLAEVATEAGARVMAVGAGSGATKHPLLDNVPWSESSEIADLQKMDIGIMPLDDTPWARGKCGYKLIQYMACGLPVIASPVGVNTDIVEHGVNGFLARDEAGWRDALRVLLNDADLRRKMGREGRRKIETQYSLEAWGPRVAGSIRSVAEKGR